MKTKTTPAPRRAGTTTTTTTLSGAYWRTVLTKLAHDDETLELAARLIEKLAERSPARSRNRSR